MGDRETGEKPQAQGKVGGVLVDILFSLTTYFYAWVVTYLSVFKPEVSP